MAVPAVPEVAAILMPEAVDPDEIPLPVEEEREVRRVSHTKRQQEDVEEEEIVTTERRVVMEIDTEESGTRRQVVERAEEEPEDPSGSYRSVRTKGGGLGRSLSFEN